MLDVHQHLTLVLQNLWRGHDSTTKTQSYTTVLTLFWLFFCVYKVKACCDYFVLICLSLHPFAVFLLVLHSCSVAVQTDDAFQHKRGETKYRCGN